MAFIHETSAQNCGCTNCPQPIPDESVTDLFIQVSNATNPTLGQKGQGLCGVELFFQHEYLGDLEIVLTSPSGQKIILVAPVDFFPNPSGGGATDGTVWNVRFVQCNDAADPDPGFAAKWDNQQVWGAFGNYSGSYYPHIGCLETLSGNVNGVWKLTITDGNAEDEGFFADYRLIFCDPSGINCYSCEANAGNLLQADWAACAGDSTLKLKLPPTYTALNPAPQSPGYQYAYVVSGKGGVIQRYDSIPDLRMDTAGVYTICGLSFLGVQKKDLPQPDGKFTVQQLSNLLNSANAPICGDVSTNCVNVTIHPIPADVRDTVTICAPDCYTFGSRTLCSSGIYTDTLQKNGCRYLSTLWLNVVTPDTVRQREVICKGECSATPGFASACDNGTYELLLKNNQGCDSLVLLNLKVLSVKSSIKKPDSLSCAIKQITLDGSGSSKGAGISYNWSARNGGMLQGVINGETAIAATEGDYQLKVCELDTSGAICCDSTTVRVGMSKAAPPLPIGISGPVQTCRGDTNIYSIPSIPGIAAYGWSAPSGAKITLLPGDTAISVIWSQAVTGEICVVAIDSCGNKTPNLCLKINVLDVFPSTLPNGAASVCEAQKTQYSISPVLDATGYIWSVNSPHLITAGQGTNTVTIQWGDDPLGSVCVAIQNLCGTGAETCRDVKVNLLPEIPAILGPTTLCAGDTAEYQLIALPGSTFAWKINNGTVIGNSNDLTIRVLWASGAGSVCATLTNNCGDGPQACLNVEAGLPPVFGLLDRQCDTLTGTYTVRFPIVGGKAPYSVQGGTVANDVFTSDPIADGKPYNFQITDANGCASELISGLLKCECKTNAGQMKPEKLVVCEGGVFTIAAPVGSRLDTNDIGIFVLHTNADNTLGTILSESATGSFTKIAGIDFDVVYYISYVVGDRKNGRPDPDDPCFQVAPGQPVVFVRNPIADAGPDLSTCGQSLTLDAKGIGKWSVESAPVPGSLWIANTLSNNSLATSTLTGTYKLTWTVTDLNGCLGTDEMVLHFNTSPQLLSLTRECDPNNTSYTVNIQITNGTPPYQLNGQPLAGNSFTSLPIINQAAYSFDIKDNNGCIMPSIKGAYDCKCSTTAGTMSAQLLQVCEGGLATAVANTDQVLEANDITAFVLHDGNGPALGNVFARNANGQFMLQPGMSFGVTYYISRVAGNNLNGSPDPSDLCFSVAKGQPVVFLKKPLPKAGNDTLVCGQIMTLNAAKGFYKGKWTVISGPGLALFTDNSNPGSSASVSVVGSYQFKWEESNSSCSGSDTVNVIFSEEPVIENIIQYCNGTNTDYVVEFQVNKGQAPFMVNGLSGSFNNNIFTSKEQPSGSGYNFFVTDAKGCRSATDFGTHICECMTNAGNMKGVTQTIIFCSAELAIAEHRKDEVLDANDALEFVLHDGTGTQLGKVLDRNNQPTFPFLKTYTFGKTYYISAIAGNRLANGAGVDLKDVCLSSTPGVPIIWKQTPEITIMGNDTICSGAKAVLSFAGQGAYPLTLAWSDGTDLKELVLTGSQIVTLDVSPLQTTSYYLIAAFDGAQPVCATALTDFVTLTVDRRPEAGAQDKAPIWCQDAGDTIALNALLINADFGGNWSEVSAKPSKPGAFDANNGIFRSNGVLPGNYKFQYVMSSSAACPGDTSTAEIEIMALPPADAGENQTLNCDQTAVILGSDGIVPNATYLWLLGQDTVGKTAQTSAVEAGQYILYVTLPPGCIATDTVEVDLDNSPPEATFLSEGVRCYGEKNGAIMLDSLLKGRPPVLYSLNGAPFSNQTKFGSLAAGSYTITLQDANGCEWTSPAIEVSAPSLLTATLMPNDTLISLGDSLLISLQSSVPVTSLERILWVPLLDTLNINKPFQQLTPVRPQVLTVEIIDSSGCKAKATALIRVDRHRQVFIPNIIDPQSSENGTAMIYAGNDVELVKGFEIFDRWGDLVFQQQNFQPNDPTKAWNGMVRGEKILPGVLSWRAEILFKDGVTEVFFGTLSIFR